MCLERLGGTLMDMLSSVLGERSKPQIMKSTGELTGLLMNPAGMG